jgi:hypothetical protein
VRYAEGIEDIYLPKRVQKMKTSTRIFTLLLITLIAIAGQTVRGQNVLNPNDTLVTFNPKDTPTLPAFGAIHKWVRTVRMSWNTSQFKAYIYNACQFRLCYPKSYNPTANDGKKYPMLIFDHGEGELGTIYDNEMSLLHGGQIFANAVAAGTFDGYVLVMQTGGGWGPSQFVAQQAIIDYMVANNKLDPFRVVGNGLSGGGAGIWGMFYTNPSYFAGILPMSSVSAYYTSTDSVNDAKFSDIWNIHGGLDGSPAPATALQVLQAMQAAGADYTDLDMTTQGHDTWDSTWSMPAFWPWELNQYCSNPWTLFGQTQFCPGVTPNVTIGLPIGFQAYQWRMNGVVQPQWTTHSIQVNQYGTYDARVERNGNWSDWSHVPVVIGIKQPTVTPPISVQSGMSDVLPAPNGQTSVNLQVPDSNYTSFTWEQPGNSTVLGTSQVYKATTPGQYIVSVTQQFGCSSNFSPPFTVINANGPNPPSPAANLVAAALSSFTQVQLEWARNPHPTHVETGFEIYRSTRSGGPWAFVGQVPADTVDFLDKGLTPNTTYFYVVRTIDSTAAAPLSNQASATTASDRTPPTAPGNLQVVTTSSTSVSLIWNSATDNVGVTGYFIYVDGAKSYATSAGDTTITVSGLNSNQEYAFYVVAVDGSGNVSAHSNQVSAPTVFSGLTYNYYTTPTAWSVLPNFSTLTPVMTGNMSTVNINNATQTTNFGYTWQGYLTVPVAGTYTFATTSDDGSAMWFNATGPTGTPTVNNDGQHGSTTVSSKSMTLKAGVYPIYVEYFQAGGGYNMSLSWASTALFGNNTLVPIAAQYFKGSFTAPGTAPAAPSNVKAVAQSYDAIGVTWKDNSNNETGFEIWRSTSPSTGFVTVGSVGAGVTSFVDNSAAASTRYYYEVRADNLYGESPFAMNYTEAEWKFNNNYNDSTGNGYTLTAVGSPVFDATTKEEGAYSLKLSGSNQGATIPNTGNFLLTGYSQLTVAGWIKPSSTTVANQVIFDIGGSDNGLALVLNKTTLVAAVASANVRSSVSVAFNSTAWNHVAVVYNGDSLLLYVNGTLAASTTSLTFHSIGTTTNGSRFGETNGTNAFNTTGSAYPGWIDDFGVYSTAFTQDVIQALQGFTYAQSNATTQALPAKPTAPTGLATKTVTSSSITLSWTNTASNAANVQVYRSANTNTQYVQWAVLPASATSFTDSGLFSNATYYYEVQAVNVGGNSAFTSAVSATTPDVPPEITKLPATEQARYGATTVINLSATTANSGGLTFAGYNLPSFAGFVDNGNGTSTLTINPTVAQAGTYPGLYITVTDVFGGADTTRFSLAVNGNYPPVLDSVVNFTINEGDTLTIPLVATDQNSSDTLSLSAVGAPPGSTVTAVSNGAANLFVHPGYSAAGVYNITATVNDNNGLSATRGFVLTVKYKNPNQKILTRFAYQDVNALGAPWNALQGTSTSNLVDSNGNVTNIGLQFTPNSWWNTFSGGQSTGNNSGVYPDVVETDYLWFGSIYGGPNVFNGTVTGADTSQLYTLTFFANSVYNGVPNNGTTTYTAGGQTVSLSVQGNTQNTVSIASLKPNPDGTIPFAAGLGPNTVLGYINAVVITKQFDDGTAPAGVSGLAATDAPGKVQLSWTDSAYNATGYEVWRALASNGIYSLQSTVGGNSASSYADSNVTGNTAYIYKVRAINTHGNSAFDSVSTMTLTRTPKIGTVANITMVDTQSVTVNVTTSDDPTAQLTLTATNLPPFASFTDNGNGTGVLTVTPSAGTTGVYSNVTITVTDQYDSAASTSFVVAVTEPNVQSVYLNFTGGAVSPLPWNSMTTPPFANSVMSNLTDAGGNPTAISATLLDGFSWSGYTGWVTGNNDPIYPQSVVQNFYYLYNSSVTNSRIQFSGLSDSLQYNFVFFNSQWDGTNGMTYFTINGVTDSLQADWNINRTVQINGIRPVNGVVTLSVSKGPAAAVAYINSVVIQGYDTAAGTLLNPAGLITTGVTQTTVSLRWQDRSAIETGYEVWRASDNSGGTYSLIASLPANTVTYKDTKLTRGLNYYYIVRAVDGSNHSNYSNVVAATTYSDAVYIAVNNTPAAPSPWNNLNQSGSIGTSWFNFIDSTGAPTSLSMVQTGNFAGPNSLGDVTGNNSGVYPDAVLKYQYVLFAGNVGSFTLSGLNLSKTYDITFMGSESYEIGNDNTAYISGSDTVWLNAMNNTNATVTMRGLTPDANGNLNLSMISYGASEAGWLNAMVINGYTPVPRNAPAPPQVAGGANTTADWSSPTALVAQSQTVNTDTVVSAYPNPFHTSFTLQVPVAFSNENVMVAIYDAHGNLVYRKEFDGLVQGENYLMIESDGNFAGTGVYVARLMYSDGKTIKTIKLLKQ